MGMDSNKCGHARDLVNGEPSSTVPPVGYDSVLTPPAAGWNSVYDFQKGMGAPMTGIINNDPYFPAGVICPDATVVWTLRADDGYPINYSYGMNTSDIPRIVGPPIFFYAWKVGKIYHSAEKICFTEAIGNVSTAPIMAAYLIPMSTCPPRSCGRIVRGMGRAIRPPRQDKYSLISPRPRVKCLVLRWPL